MNTVQSGIIYKTSDYSIFKELDFNRTASERRIQGLMSSLSERQARCPIVVDKHMRIIDGQGRLEACKRLGLEVEYVIDDNATIDDCRRMNINNTKWTMSDFVESYAKQGNENYVELIRCGKLSGRKFEKIMAAFGLTGSSRKEIAYSGRLIFTPEMTEQFLQIVKEADLIKDALDKKGETAKFISAVKTILNTKGYNSKHMIDNCKKYRRLFNPDDTTRGILSHFSDVYNKGWRQKLHFEDAISNRGYTVREYGQYSEEKDARTIGCKK